ncbi:DUF6153 family protein [Streptomyces sp. NPDC056600]|uniref:DUF6153 family protein n=1 Tax=Streptomyces sp. NPDC056600 TaxID=3345874 RepID=UPI0036BDB1E0
MITGLGTHRRPAGRLFALLVLAVLAGLFGMHALAPGGGLDRPRSESHSMQAAHGEQATHSEQDARGMQAAHSPVRTVDAGPHQGHGGGSGHLSHADDTCAAAGPVSAYTPPPPTGVPAVLSAAPPAHPSGAPASALPVRAPPDLTALQLLRI